MASDGVTPIKYHVREVVRRHVLNGTMNAAEIAAAVRDAVLADEGFLKLLREMVLVLAAGEARQQIKQAPARGRRYTEPEESVPERGLVPVASGGSSQGTVLEWIERFEGRTKAVRHMTREELRSAAMEREDGAQANLQVAWLWRRLADKMPSGKTVGECYSVSQLMREFRPLTGEAGETDYKRYYLGVQKAAALLKGA